MARYFVVLKGVQSLGHIVLAEVVREASDLGHFRDTSLAANLAGPAASILTEEELVELPGGRAALARWRRSDDNAFALDTIAEELTVDGWWAAGKARSPLMTATQVRDLAARNKLLSERIRIDTANLRRRSAEMHEQARLTLEEIQRQHQLLARKSTAATEDPEARRAKPRRHLRSVS